MTRIFEAVLRETNKLTYEEIMQRIENVDPGVLFDIAHDITIDGDEETHEMLNDLDESELADLIADYKAGEWTHAEIDEVLDTYGGL